MPASLMGRTILVTGGNGFIGRTLVARLARDPETKIILLTRPGSPSPHFRSPAISTLPCDLGDAEAVAAAVKPADAIVNLAYDHARPEANPGYTQRLAEAARRAGVSRFVHASSIAVYEPLFGHLIDETAARPRDQKGYAAIKQRQDDLLRAAHRDHGLPVIILQPTIVYGPAAGVWTTQPARQILSGEVFLPGEGQGLANLVHVEDVAQAIEAALIAPEAALGESFLISGADRVTWLDFYRRFELALGRDAVRPVAIAQLAELREKPWLRLRAALRRPVETLRFRLPVKLPHAPLPLPRVAYLPDPQHAAFLSARSTVSIAKARALLGYAPAIDFAPQGAAALAAYLRRAYGSRDSLVAPRARPAA